MAERKKTVLIQTDHALAKTGFGRNCRAVCEYLYATGKYNLINFAVGSMTAPDLTRTPWKTVAAFNPQQVEEIKRQNDPRNWEGIEKMAGYGAYQLDAAVQEYKPDVVIAAQDIWGIDFSVDKSWFKNTTSVLWTTLDSLPILPKAVELAPKVKHYWSWADFATKALHKLGHQHVRTVRGALDDRYFFRHPDKTRKELRDRFGIPQNTFVIGYVFRNQLRKSVPNLLEGYQLFKKANPGVDTRLLLHTCWAEGWNIPKLMKEYDIPSADVLTTYVCKNCRTFHVKPFVTNHENCPTCGAKGTPPTQENPHGSGMVTTHPTIGVSEENLNDIYNLMSVYCHPFTSGGQEIPIQEAKLTELITLVTNYSCGEDSCEEGAGSLALDWAEYREHGTEFIKASTYPSSIAKQLTKVLKLSDKDRREMGRVARQWVLDNFSIKVIGKILEDFIDSVPFTTFDFNEKPVPREPQHQIPVIQNDADWLVYLYHNLLKMPVDTNDEGHKHWMQKLREGMPRHQIEQFFRQTASNENQRLFTTQVKFEDLLNKDDKGRVIMVLPESAGDIFLSTALFKSIKRRYPDWTFYVATKPPFREIIEANPYVDKWLEYHPMMDNLTWLEGHANHNGFFNVAYLPHSSTQRFINYYHNGQDKLDLQLHETS